MYMPAEALGLTQNRQAIAQELHKKKIKNEMQGQNHLISRLPNHCLSCLNSTHHETNNKTETQLHKTELTLTTNLQMLPKTIRKTGNSDYNVVWLWLATYFPNL